MNEIYLLAPGPSATKEIAEKIKLAGKALGVITSAYPLAPWAHFIISADRQWWIKTPEALSAPGRKFCASDFKGTERVRTAQGTNSGVLALECAKKLGAQRIYLFGFDMRGTHYFGPYTNGLKNTVEARRKVHLSQYAGWSRNNKSIKVFNCTPGSAISCFEFIDEIRIQN